MHGLPQILWICEKQKLIVRDVPYCHVTPGHDLPEPAESLVLRRGLVLTRQDAPSSGVQALRESSIGRRSEMGVGHPGHRPGFLRKTAARQSWRRGPRPCRPGSDFAAKRWRCAWDAAEHAPLATVARSRDHACHVATGTHTGD